MQFELITKDLPLEEIQRIVGNNSGVYLIHFDKALGHAEHYLGYSSKLSERLEIHKKGGSDSATIMQTVKAQGITWKVVHVWVGKNWLFEKQMKKMAKVKRVCPLCRDQELEKAATYMKKRRRKIHLDF